MGKLKHNCGLGAVYNSNELIRDLYKIAISQQLRGEEGVGIGAYVGDGVALIKDIGSVYDVFHNVISKADIKSDRGIVHNRYSTTGESTAKNVQPIRMDGLALAHQGNLVNGDELRNRYGGRYQLLTDLDSEGALCIFSEVGGDIKEFAYKLYEDVIGAYNMALINEKGEIGIIRDPRAFHPLFVAEKNGTYYIASEDIVFPALGIFDSKLIREVKPGEVIILSENGFQNFIVDRRKDEKLLRCYFEPLYFMMHGSTHKGIDVSDIRKDIGKVLARKYKINAHAVVPVMDSGIDYGRGYSEESGIPLNSWLIKNRYIGRTYTTPEGKGENISDVLKMNRMEKSMLKNIPKLDKVRGKRLIITDDSIVRVNVSKGVAKSLFEAGAEEIHFMIGSPPIMHPCFYGMDHSTKRELVAASCKNVEEANQYVARNIADEIGVDRKRITVNYASFDDIKEPLRDCDDHCSICVHGGYYHDIPDTEKFQKAFVLD